MVEAPTIPDTIGQKPDSEEILTVLDGYRAEAENNRKSGMNPRDDRWSRNLDLYWNRMDFSAKAAWQSKEVMPEVPAYVDRFAAALKEALVTSPNGFYTVVNPWDKGDDLKHKIKQITDIALTTVGRNQTGQLLDFSATFEEQMKLAALTAASQVVMWKNDVKGGRVAIEAVDPRNVWLDHTYRNLYRIRRTTIDRHELGDMMKRRDKKGRPLFNPEGMVALMQGVVNDMALAAQELSGTGQEIMSTRGEITLDEYIATVVSRDGRVLATDALMVVANGRYLIRGPEKNPYWHGKDWLMYTPLVTVPLSPYGRSYMEDFGDVATVFTEMTNLLLDAAKAAAIKAYVIVPGMLADPSQALGGVTPGKTFLLDDAYPADSFAKELALGSVDPTAIQMWQALKNELTEGAWQNEIGLGQFAPNSRTSATEIMATQQSSSSILRSVAQTIEARHLNPTLDLVWKTLLQHVSVDDVRYASAVGEDMWGALHAERRQLITEPITFQARGISTLIQKSQMLQSLMQLLQIISTNDMLLQAFMQKVDVNKLMNLLFWLSNVDPDDVSITQRDRAIRQITAPILPGGGGEGGVSDAANSEMAQMAQALGVAA